MSRFPGYAVGSIALPDVGAEPVFAEDRAVRDVPSAFARLRERGDPIAVWDAGLIPEHRYTRVNLGNQGRARNHFQGVQRLRDGVHAVVSGGDINEPASHVFVVRLASCQHDGPWGSNLLFAREPSLNDGVVRTIALDRDFWHAGGLSLLGDVLAVPLEGDAGSRIVFLDLADLDRPRRIPCLIDRPGRKAGAVALTRLPDGRFLCVVWWEVKHMPRGRLDLYASRTDRLADGFLPTPHEWSYGRVLDGDGRDPCYQCINIVREHGTDSLYLIGTENGTGAAPIFGGPDLADLFRLELSPGFADAPDRFGVQLIRIHGLRVLCPGEFGNLDAVGGVFVDRQGELHLYAGFHWRVDGMIRLCELSAGLAPDAPPIVSIDDARIEMYEHERFRGRRLTIRGRRRSRLEHYGRILVEGAPFDDRVSSVRYVLPAGVTYRLFRDPDFRAGTAGREFLDLVGTGTLVESPNLASRTVDFGDRVSSSCYT